MDKRTLNKLQRAVVRGAAFLDERRPSWFTKINTSKLDLDDCELCVLGQLYSNDYSRGLHVLNGAVAMDPERFGFEVQSDDFEKLDERYAAITEMWREEVAARRRARRKSVTA